MVNVIILAAGSIREKVHFARYCFDCPALVPVNVRTVASHILDFYLAHPDARCTIVVNEKDRATVAEELAYYGDAVRIWPVAPTRGVVETLDRALAAAPRDAQDILVNLVTTIPTAYAEGNQAILSDQAYTCSAWSSVRMDGDRPSFIYKDDPQARTEQGHAFTGVFRCRRGDLETALCSPRRRVNDLLSVVDALYEQGAISFRMAGWLDCGHESNYYDTKLKLTTSRHFNIVSADGRSGVITKCSDDPAKLTREVNYVRMLPDELAMFYPRIVGQVQQSDGQASVRMEYYGYPTLAEYMLYWVLDEYTWRRIMQSLEHVIELERRYPHSIGQQAYVEFYLGKCDSRLQRLVGQLPDEYRDLLLSSPLRINGRPCRNFQAISGDVMERLLATYNEADFCIMHGDLCFNNILHDLNSGVTRLIDARGSFGDQCVGIYGDIKYDLTKLTHSIIGGYDYIVNRNFRLQRHGPGDYSYSLSTRPWQGFLEQINVRLIERFGYRLEDILFLVGLVFVSICPLHGDDVRKQVLMYLHGIQFLNRALEKVANG